MENKIIKSLNKFKLNLNNRIVLTEAATGKFVITPIIAALAEAKKVYAYTRDSEYGSVAQVVSQTNTLADKLLVKDRISILTDLDKTDLKEIDILTNTGFLRPINNDIIRRLSSKCVIPLMWEPWEYRKEELDLESCYQHGIKIYGTNESNKNVRTMEYIGLTVLCHLLNNNVSPFNSNVLLIGCKRFVEPTLKILRQNVFNCSTITDYTNLMYSINDYDAIVILEHERSINVIGDKEAFIHKENINKHTIVIHICGNVNLKDAEFIFIPENPKPFGHMSFTADYVDSQAVIDLHAAGLKVAEGMCQANELKLKGAEYKLFMESNYPALSFEDSRFW